MPVCGSTSAIFRSKRLDVRSFRLSSAIGISASDAVTRLTFVPRRGGRSLRMRGALSASDFSVTSDGSSTAAVGCLFSRGGRAVRSSGTTPEPKSSSLTAGVAASGSSAAGRRARVDGRRGVVGVVRVVVRRRGRSLVPSESELLVGINLNLTGPCNGEAYDDIRQSA